MAIVWTSVVWAWNTRDDPTESLYTHDQANVIDDSWMDDPLRAGTLDSAKWMKWIAKINNDSAESRQKWFVDYVSIWVNYILGLLGLIVIIFIIKDGLAIITAAWDDNKKKEALKNVRNYILAIIFIWVSYLIVNLVFNFMDVNTK